jgi:hypothetical protein
VVAVGKVIFDISMSLDGFVVTDPAPESSPPDTSSSRRREQ